MRDKNKPKNQIGGGTLHEKERHGKRKFAVAGILAALALVVCAAVAVITPAVAANTSNTGGFSMANVISSVKMFYGCGEIEGQNGTTYNSNIIDAEYANIDTDAEAGYLSTADVCAFAVYSADDNSLTFYNQNIGMVVVGEKFRGKTVTAVYTGFDTETYTQATVPWYDYRGDIVTVTVADEIAIKSTKHWFWGFTNCTSMDLENLDTSGVTDMSYMFGSCSSLTKLDLSSFNTSKVTNMRQMFASCSKLASLDLSSFDTSKVTDMGNMFAGMTVNASSTMKLDLSSFNTSKVTDMSQMFYGASNIKTIYVSSKWSTANVNDSTKMFYYCNSLVGGNGTTYNVSYIDATYARIDTASKPGYFTSK